MPAWSRLNTYAKRWYLASRPFTLTASVAPVLVGSALAFSEEAADLLMFVLMLTASLLVQIGSFDGGFGAIYLARVVGEKKAREIWYLCRQYSAEEALGMGLVNAVVPQEELETTVMSWCQELLEKSPTALRFLKHSFNADTDHVYGIQNLAHGATAMYYTTEEGKEGSRAFLEKRAPDFSRFRRHPW